MVSMLRFSQYNEIKRIKQPDLKKRVAYDPYVTWTGPSGGAGPRT